MQCVYRALQQRRLDRTLTHRTEQFLVGTHQGEAMRSENLYQRQLDGRGAVHHEAAEQLLPLLDLQSVSQSVSQ